MSNCSAQKTELRTLRARLKATRGGGVWRKEAKSALQTAAGYLADGECQKAQIFAGVAANRIFDIERYIRR